MGNKFLLNYNEMKDNGVKFHNESDEFDADVKKLYNLIGELTTTSYISDASREMANNFETFKDDFSKMTKLIADCGSYCINAARTELANQENIVDNFSARKTQL